MTSDIAFIALTNLAILAALFVCLWAFSVHIKNASIVDIAWGPACAAPAVLTLLRADGAEPRASLLVILVSAWALRLAAHLACRNIGSGEDFRYQAMRRRYASDAVFARASLIRIFGLQCLIAWFVSLPVQVGQIGGSGALGWLAVAGIVLFALGLAFETVGDWQLARFKSKSENAGKLMTGGLWGLTRHPNYFGDAAVWSGLTLIALEAPFGWTTLFSPIVMTYFLVNVSGKALLERAMERKYPDYAAYKARVSGFIPRPPKSA